MMRYKILGGNITGEILANRMLYLAWQACGRPFGMGVLQDRGEQTEDQVWESAVSGRDYAGFHAKRSGEGKINADYVNGRMMKLYFKYGDDYVEADRGTKKGDWHISYQSFCGTYPEFGDLVNAAAESLHCSMEMGAPAEA